jgi:hypothetical protein
VSNPSFKMRMDDKMSCLLICGMKMMNKCEMWLQNAESNQ